MKKFDDLYKMMKKLMARQFLETKEIAAFLQSFQTYMSEYLNYFPQPCFRDNTNPFQGGAARPRSGDFFVVDIKKYVGWRKDNHDYEVESKPA